MGKVIDRLLWVCFIFFDNNRSRGYFTLYVLILTVHFGYSTNKEFSL